MLTIAHRSQADQGVEMIGRRAKDRVHIFGAIAVKKFAIVQMVSAFVLPFVVGVMFVDGIGNRQPPRDSFVVEVFEVPVFGGIDDVSDRDAFELH